MDLAELSRRRPAGRVVRVSGPLVELAGLPDVAMSEVVELGPHRLPAEVVAVRGDRVSVQAYEYTGGLSTQDIAYPTGMPLVARLGPGLLGGVFDGLLRPLTDAPTWLGATADRSGQGRRCTWQPQVASGATVAPGQILGVLPNQGAVEHRVLVPPDASGVATGVAGPGTYGMDDVIATIGGTAVRIGERWPVRRIRPAWARLQIGAPLITGQRVLDAIFPIVRGGTAAVPGGFGTGKTLLLQQIAKWCDADVIVYVGCGERGNEMADVLAEFQRLDDPRTNRRLADRTVIIANTSNMPMMAREASIYTGVAVAEYFRDMGYHVVVIADSTSRWAEALREYASRSGALPTEEGYPASLASALAAFYERAGRFTTLGGAEGSVTVIGAVSPPGGDVTEPVTAHTQRFVRGVWSLDRDLAYARHYPAVAWAGSFARDADAVTKWYADGGDPGWAHRRARVTSLLAEADRVGEVAELLGATSLPARERVTLLAGRLLREGVLQQSALSTDDAHCAPGKSAALIDAMLTCIDRCQDLVTTGVAAEQIEATDFAPLLRAAQETRPDDAAGVSSRGSALVDRLATLS